MTASLEPARRHPGPDNATARSIRVWDLPTRLFHWALALIVVCLLATGFGGVMEWHFRFGYATLALIGFRVMWGFFGSQTSRFSSFLRGPRAVLRYLRDSMSKNPQTHVGHNPLGGW